MTENERIKLVRKHLSLTQKAFSQTLDIKQGSYSDVERGKAGVSALLLKNLIKKYRVNPLWLCEGEGHMFFDPNSNMTKNSNTDVSTTKINRENLNEFILQEQQSVENIKEILSFLSNESCELH